MYWQVGEKPATAGSSASGRANPLLMQMYMQRGVMPPKKFGMMSPTVKGTLDQFFKVTTPPPRDVDVTMVDFATQIVTEIFHPELMEARRRGWRKATEVELDLKKSPGEPWSSQFHCQTKEDVLFSDVALPEFINSVKYMEAQEVNLYKVSPKVEIVAMDKVIERAARTFEVAPYHYLLKGNMYLQNFADIMKQRKNKMFSAYGIVLQHGGWSDLMQQIGRYKYKYASDVRKWDKHVWMFLLEKAVAILRTIAPEDEDYLAFLSYLIRNEMWSIYVLPDGRIIMKIGGMLWNSGTLLTTIINILIHDIIFVYHLLRVKGVMSRNVLIGEAFFPYGDDSGGGTNDPRIASFVERQKTYAQFGMELKPEDDFVSESLEGFKFLGFTNRGGVPVFDRDRILDGMLLSEGEMSPQQEVSRMIAMVYLSSMDSGVFHYNDESGQVCTTSFARWVYDTVKLYLETYYSDAELKTLLGTHWPMPSLEQFRALFTERVPIREVFTFSSPIQIATHRCIASLMQIDA